MISPPQVVVETVAITTGRVALVYFCRTYLLRFLYNDLRQLSSSSLSTSASSPEPLSGYRTPVSPSVIPLNSLTPELSDAEQSLLPSPSSTPRRKSKGAMAFVWPPKSGAAAAQTLLPKSESNLHLALARTTFALCFSESCILFLMVMFQAVHVFTPRTRMINWDISLALLICFILLLIPLLQFAFVTSRSVDSPLWSSRRMFMILFPYALYLLAVFKIPVPEALASADFISKSLSRLTVIGVLILGLISGYGCVSTASMFFADVARSDWVEPSKQDILSAEQSLFRVRSDLLERRQEADKRASLLDSTTGTTSTEPAGWFGRISSVWKGGDAELTNLQREIQGLQLLEREMEQGLKELHVRKSRIQFSRTFKGKLWKWIGWAFGLYCAFRVLSSLVNLVLPHGLLASYASSPSSSSARRPPDLITLLLTYIVSSLPLPASLSFLRLDSPEQIAAVSRQISLVLVGCIVLVSVRGVLRGVGRVLRAVSGSSSHSSTTGAPQGSSRRALIANIMLLILAQVMGLYLLSTLIQLRNSFPPSETTEKDDISLFASLPSYEVFNSLFDWAFLSSAGCTAGVTWIRPKIGL